MKTIHERKNTLDIIPEGVESEETNVCVEEKNLNEIHTDASEDVKRLVRILYSNDKTEQESERQF